MKRTHYVVEKQDVTGLSWTELQTCGTPEQAEAVMPYYSRDTSRPLRIVRVEREILRIYVKGKPCVSRDRMLTDEAHADCGLCGRD
jgi:hypothetical protein